MTRDFLVEHLLSRLREVQERLGGDADATAQTLFAQAVDSMGLVEFVGVVAADCGATTDAIEDAVQRRFSTVEALARAMHAARLLPLARPTQAAFGFASQEQATAWLARWATVKPSVVERSYETDRLLDRPDGWLEQHAGIRLRGRWRDEDPLTRTVEAVRECLPQPRQLSVLLVTSEAPPTRLGVAARVHRACGLSADVPALEVGGACLGALHALWLGRNIVRPGRDVLIVALEAHTQWLRVRPGPEGENAALFGDGAAACLLTAEEQPGALPLRDLILGCDATGAALIDVQVEQGGANLLMDGPALALRAVERLAAVVGEVCQRNEVGVEELEAVYVHAGNGRMPPLVARRLNLPEDRVLSTTPLSGNLGSVSLLAALSQHRPRGNGPVALAAVGAGLNWGAALFGAAVGL